LLRKKRPTGAGAAGPVPRLVGNHAVRGTPTRRSTAPSVRGGARGMSAMQLLDWKRLDKGALVGRATVLLPSGLQISDIGIVRKAGRAGSQRRSEAMREASGQILKDERGKTRYRSPPEVVDARAAGALFGSAHRTDRI